VIPVPGKTLRFVFAVHNHQPVGNFWSVFEEAYTRSYRPFLDVLERYPTVKFTAHWTGPLLEWLVDQHPEYVERLRVCAGRGQLEVLGGGYYEPILAVIPEADRVGQIRKLSSLVESLFGVSPRGMWLAERVWEQSLVRSIAAAEMEFVCVDDTHFLQAGVPAEAVRGYYMTEDGGVPLRVFPIDKKLRYSVPFRDLDETMSHFIRQAESGAVHTIVHADDGEKFGVWPRTYEHVFEKGWLDQFCRRLVESGAWLQTAHLGEVIDAEPPTGTVALPDASYVEMMKWALPAEAQVRLDLFETRLKEAELHTENAHFVRGASWRNFLARYPEANHLHKKMLRVAKRCHAATPRVSEKVLEHLWAAQCNDVYWHGSFGGLYLPYLRFSAYRHLLQAESALDARAASRTARLEQTDADSDGHEEILYESRVQDLWLAPSTGGTLYELDFKPAAVNLLDCLSRREERYHRQLREREPGDRLELKEEDLGSYLAVDWYRHGSFVDHLLGPGTTLEGISRCVYPELGDFVNQPYAAEVRKRRGAVEVSLRREGALWRDGSKHRISIAKTFTLRDGKAGFDVEYLLRNLEDAPAEIWFAVELVIGGMAGNAPDRYYTIDGKPPDDPRLSSAGETPDVSGVSATDEWLGIRTGFQFGTHATLWRFPLETVSRSEGGLERLYQASVLMPHWRFTLPGAQGEVALRLSQTIESLSA
jgi:4-alpha-glucanotransferase